jgi:hypothetical protein
MAGGGQDCEAQARGYRPQESAHLQVNAGVDVLYMTLGWELGFQKVTRREKRLQRFSLSFGRST